MVRLNYLIRIFFFMLELGLCDLWISLKQNNSCVCAFVSFFLCISLHIWIYYHVWIWMRKKHVFFCSFVYFPRWRVLLCMIFFFISVWLQNDEHINKNTRNIYNKKKKNRYNICVMLLSLFFSRFFLLFFSFGLFVSIFRQCVTDCEFLTPQL